MRDDIYFRLLLELAPENLKPNHLDAERIFINFGETIESRIAFGKLLQRIYETKPDSDIGLCYGKLLRPHALCELSRAVMTAATFNDSLNTFGGLQHMQGLAYYLSTYQTKTKISLALVFPHEKKVTPEKRRFSTESGFSYLVNFVRETIDPSLNPEHIYLSYDEPHYSKDYEEFFRCPITFGAPLSQLEFDNGLGAVRLKTSNHVLFNMLMLKCQDIARTNERHWEFDYRTSTNLMLHHPHSFNCDTISRILNISPRGLQKKLSKLGTSFSALSSLARIELAKVYLVQQEATLEQTAERLGFQTVSGFRRFFKAEFGITTAEFMQQKVVEHKANENLLEACY